MAGMVGAGEGIAGCQMGRNSRTQEGQMVVREGWQGAGGPDRGNWGVVRQEESGRE